MLKVISIAQKTLNWRLQENKKPWLFIQARTFACSRHIVSNLWISRVSCMRDSVLGCAGKSHIFSALSDFPRFVIMLLFFQVWHYEVLTSKPRAHSAVGKCVKRQKWSDLWMRPVRAVFPPLYHHSVWNNFTSVPYINCTCVFCQHSWTFYFAPI